jgi:uncharacterized protein YjbJ (UPF0337 family)
MGLKNKAKATAKDLEGKLQEGVGDITGNLETQAEGQTKQMEAKAMRTAEEIKDSAKKAVN